MSVFTNIFNISKKFVNPCRKYSKIAVLGACFNKGQQKEGVENGPMVVRQTGVLDKLKEFGLDVFDAGDLFPPPSTTDDKGPNGELFYNNVFSFNSALTDNISDLMKNGYKCLTIGGDHSIGIGTVTGHSRGQPDKEVKLLWIDAHPDINTGVASSTKNMHGMPISYLLKELAPQNYTPNSNWHKPCIDPKNIVYIGLRDADQFEVDVIDKLKIKSFYMDEVDKLGINEVITRSLDHLNPKENSSIHMSFDIDSLDPVHSPSTGTPVAGGLTLREGMRIAEAVNKTGHLRGLDLVEVNPSIGSKENLKSTKIAAECIIFSALTGERI